MPLDGAAECTSSDGLCPPSFRWNSWLIKAGLKTTDLEADVRPGVYPIRLLESLSDSSCGKFNKKPLSKYQYFENHNIFLKQLKSQGIKIVSVSPVA